MADNMQQEKDLGPAERIIGTITQHADHMVHNRPGFVRLDKQLAGGVIWNQPSWVLEDGEKVVYLVQNV